MQAKSRHLGLHLVLSRFRNCQTFDIVQLRLLPSSLSSDTRIAFIDKYKWCNVLRSKGVVSGVDVRGPFRIDRNVGRIKLIFDKNYEKVDNSVFCLQ